MPQTNQMRVTVIPAGEGAAALIDSNKTMTFDNIHFVSLVNDETYGKPAVVSEDHYKSEGMPLRVLYITPQNIAAFQIERTA